MVIKIGTGNAGAQSLRLGDAARTARYAAEAKAAAEKAERSAGIAAGALQDTADNARRAEAAAAASVHPPVPGTGGTWLIWDQENGGYIDSGENCRGEKGETGGRGEKGDKGDAFTYGDFTPAQLEALRGPQGIQGETGPAGPTGATGAQGPKGDKGDTGATGPAPDMSAYRTAAAQDVIDEAQNAEIADLKSAIDNKAPVIINTASGAIASFPDGADGIPIKKLVAHIEPVQSGSGDPSPTNVRPISGWTGAQIVVSPTTDAADGQTYDITFPTEAGTVYGGTLDVTNGKLTVDMAMVDLGTLEWYYESVFTRFLMKPPYGITGIKPPRDNNTVANYLCTRYKTVSSNATASSLHDKSIGVSSVGRIDVRDESFTDGATFKAAMSGVQLVYKLATPQTYQLTPQEVTTLLGTNNVWADTGDVEVNYPADTKLYIENKITQAIANALNS